MKFKNTTFGIISKRWSDFESSYFSSQKGSWKLKTVNFSYTRYFLVEKTKRCPVFAKQRVKKLHLVKKRNSLHHNNGSNWMLLKCEISLLHSHLNLWPFWFAFRVLFCVLFCVPISVLNSVPLWKRAIRAMLMVLKLKNVYGCNMLFSYFK